MIDASGLRTTERLAAVYFAYLAGAAVARPLPLHRRVRVWLASAALLACTAAVASAPQTSATMQVRDWLPGAVILLAYFATGAFFVAPSARTEQWLRRSDDRWLRGWRPERVPWLLSVYLDIVYDTCFVLIPAGFAVLAWTGRSAQADRYWTIVSAAEFAAFGTLPWFQARPPWALEARGSNDSGTMHRFSLFWVSRTSIGATTFPSGHVSGSLGAAFALLGPMPLAGAVFLLLAVSISVACITGRYHYVADVVAGAVVAVVVWAAVAWYLPGSSG